MPGWTRSRPALLAPLAPPRVAHFCGHMFAADPPAEARLRGRFDGCSSEEAVGFAYGALACGADILFAEAALRARCRIARRAAVRGGRFPRPVGPPGGRQWLDRYRACMAQRGEHSRSPARWLFRRPRQYGYGSRMAMGLARLRADHLAAEPVQIAMWDGAPSNGPAGTGADVAAWAAQAARSRLVDPGAVGRNLIRPEPSVRSAHERSLAADPVHRLSPASRPSGNRSPGLLGRVMRRVADVLDAHDGDVGLPQQLGDALYAVTVRRRSPPRSRSSCRTARRFDYATLGLDGAGGMRIGVHYGPAWRTTRPYHRPHHLLRHRGLQGGADRAGHPARRGVRHRALRRDPGAGGGGRFRLPLRRPHSPWPRSMATIRCTG
jgi:hypothetical protein